MTEMTYQLRNPYHYTWISGDHIAEQHVHNLDVCNWIKGRTRYRHKGKADGSSAWARCSATSTTIISWSSPTRTAANCSASAVTWRLAGAASLSSSRARRARPT